MMGQGDTNIRVVEDGTVLLTEGKGSQEAFMLLKGKVAVFRKSDHNQDILLAELGEGEVFGEMSLIEDSLCSATVKAVGEVQVQVLTKKNFILALQQDEMTLQTVMGSLFQRIRTMNRQVVSLKEQVEQLPQQKVSQESGANFTGKIMLRSLTEPAKHAMDDMDMIVLDKFPYQIGRWSRDRRKKSWFFGASQDNQLSIHDIPPYTVSREHCCIEKKGKKVYLVDLGSRLGTWVNDQKVGRGGNKTIELSAGSHRICLGDRDSVFSFEVVVG